jgi:hypothetical protein
VTQSLRVHTARPARHLAPVFISGRRTLRWPFSLPGTSRPSQLDQRVRGSGAPGAPASPAAVSGTRPRSAPAAPALNPRPRNAHRATIACGKEVHRRVMSLGDACRNAWRRWGPSQTRRTWLPLFAIGFVNPPARTICGDHGLPRRTAAVRQTRSRQGVPIRRRRSLTRRSTFNCGGRTAIIHER